MNCSVPLCEKPNMACGLCSAHYSRLRRHGDVNAVLIGRAGHGHLQSGYRRFKVDGRYKPEHLIIAERVMGHPLPEEACVHHWNRVRSDNRNPNLVVCQDQAYHSLLHQRMRALAACGHANWLKCKFCKRYDSPEMITDGCHRECRIEYCNSWRSRKGA